MVIGLKIRGMVSIKWLKAGLWLDGPTNVSLWTFQLWITLYNGRKVGEVREERESICSPHVSLWGAKNRGNSPNILCCSNPQIWGVCILTSWATWLGRGSWGEQNLNGWWTGKIGLQSLKVKYSNKELEFVTALKFPQGDQPESEETV